MKWNITQVFNFIALISFIVGCSDLNDDEKPSADEKHEHMHEHHNHNSTSMDTNADREIKIVSKDFSFEPKDIHAFSGENILIELINEGTQDHMWELKGISDTHIHAAAGKKVSAVIHIPETVGNYEIICSAVGHQQAGMVGKLVVVAKK